MAKRKAERNDELEKSKEEAKAKVDEQRVRYDGHNANILSIKAAQGTPDDFLATESKSATEKYRQEADKLSEEKNKAMSQAETRARNDESSQNEFLSTFQRQFYGAWNTGYTRQSYIWFNVMLSIFITVIMEFIIAISFGYIGNHPDAKSFISKFNTKT